MASSSSSLNTRFFSSSRSELSSVIRILTRSALPAEYSFAFLDDVELRKLEKAKEIIITSIRDYSGSGNSRAQTLRQHVEKATSLEDLRRTLIECLGSTLNFLHGVTPISLDTYVMKASILICDPSLSKEDVVKKLMEIDGTVRTHLRKTITSILKGEKLLEKTMKIAVNSTLTIEEKLLGILDCCKEHYTFSPFSLYQVEFARIRSKLLSISNKKESKEIKLESKNEKMQTTADRIILNSVLRELFLDSPGFFPLWLQPVFKTLNTLHPDLLYHDIEENKPITHRGDWFKDATSFKFFLKMIKKVSPEMTAEDRFYVIRFLTQFNFVFFDKNDGYIINPVEWAKTLVAVVTDSDSGAHALENYFHGQLATLKSIPLCWNTMDSKLRFLGITVFLLSQYWNRPDLKELVDRVTVFNTTSFLITLSVYDGSLCVDRLEMVGASQCSCSSCASFIDSDPKDSVMRYYSYSTFRNINSSHTNIIEYFLEKISKSNMSPSYLEKLNEKMVVSNKSRFRIAVLQYLKIQFHILFNKIEDCFNERRLLSHEIQYVYPLVHFLQNNMFLTLEEIREAEEMKPIISYLVQLQQKTLVHVGSIPMCSLYLSFKVHTRFSSDNLYAEINSILGKMTLDYLWFNNVKCLNFNDALFNLKHIRNLIRLVIERPNSCIDDSDLLILQRMLEIGGPEIEDVLWPALSCEYLGRDHLENNFILIIFNRLLPQIVSNQDNRLRVFHSFLHHSDRAKLMMTFLEKSPRDDIYQEQCMMALEKWTHRIKSLFSHDYYLGYDNLINILDAINSIASQFPCKKRLYREISRGLSLSFQPEFHYQRSDFPPQLPDLVMSYFHYDRVRQVRNEYLEKLKEDISHYSKLPSPLLNIITGYVAAARSCR